MSNKINKKAFLIDDEGETSKSAALLSEQGYDVHVLSSTSALQKFINVELSQEDTNNYKSEDCIKIIENFETLTNREKEVTGHLVLGEGESTNKAIAKLMNISHRTVEEYRASAMRKMNSRSLKELITKAIDCKLFNEDRR